MTLEELAEKAVKVVEQDRNATDEDIKEWADKLAARMAPLPPEFQKVIDDNWWELIGT